MRCRLRGDWTPLSPGPYHKHHERYPAKQGNVGHDPGNAIEALICGRSKHERSVRLNEKLNDGIIGIAAVHGSGELLLHTREIRAAEVIALKQDLIASAHADDLASETIHAGVVARAEKEQN